MYISLEEYSVRDVSWGCEDQERARECIKCLPPPLKVIVSLFVVATPIKSAKILWN